MGCMQDKVCSLSVRQNNGSNYSEGKDSNENMTSEGRRSFGRGVYYLLMAMLLGTFIVDAMLQIRKHLDNKTTVARTMEYRDDLVMPAISFCPGYVRKEVDRLGWPKAYLESEANFSKYDSAYPQSQAEAEAAWKNYTLGLSDVLKGLSVPKGKVSLKDVFDSINASQTFVDEDLCVRIEERHTYSGRCYSLIFECPAKAKNSTHLVLNLASLVSGKMDLYLHHPGAHLGLNANFWPGSTVTVVEVDSAIESLDLSLQKGTYRDRQGQGSEQDFYDCINNKKNEMSTKMCRMPMLGSLVDGNKSAKHCRNVTEYVRATHESFKVLAWVHNPPEIDCPRPAMRTSYSAVRRQDRNAIMFATGEGVVSVYIFYETTDVVVEEEYELLDSLALLAALGGTMGICLGWSALDFARFTTDVLAPKSGGSSCTSKGRKRCKTCC